MKIGASVIIPYHIEQRSYQDIRRFVKTELSKNLAPVIVEKFEEHIKKEDFNKESRYAIEIEVNPVGAVFELKPTPIYIMSEAEEEVMKLKAERGEMILKEKKLREENEKLKRMIKDLTMVH